MAEKLAADYVEEKVKQADLLNHFYLMFLTLIQPKIVAGES